MNDTITELTALEEKATPGPWENQDENEDRAHGAIGIEDKHVALCGFYNARDETQRVTREEQKANTALIVTMRNALPELLWGLQLNHNLKMERDVFLADAEKYKEERDATLARAEKAESELSAEKSAHDDTRAYWRKLSIGVAQDADTDIATLKARAEKAEAERDVLAEALADGDCPYLAFWQDCPEERPEWCECTDTDDSGFECCWHGGSQRCWRKWAAQEVAKRGEEA